MSHGPLLAIVPVYSDLLGYTATGTDTESLGDHLVSIVGWGQEETGEGESVPYWVCRYAYGQDGYIRVHVGGVRPLIGVPTLSPLPYPSSDQSKSLSSPSPPMVSMGVKSSLYEQLADAPTWIHPSTSP
ncbi:hypothetical protein KIPB_016289, partial [Kipferlia bialata]|eukprot:g16289.t1